MFWQQQKLLNRNGRSISYSPNFQNVNRLMNYLMENSCGGEGCEIDVPGPVRCRAQSANTEAESRPVLRANTRVFLRLTKTLAKHDTRSGEPVEFVVDSNVALNASSDRVEVQD